jgi:DNA-binding transcriptional LysR family regulator
MEIRQLKTFETVANLLSFNKAAKFLNYAQSSISAQIKALEDDLGVLLFDRLEKRVVLTEAGLTLLTYARRILDLTEETRAEVVSEQATHGHLNIRVPESMSSYRMVPAIKRFQELYPATRITLSTCVYHDLSKDLAKGIYDLGFLYTDSFISQELSQKFLGSEPLVIVAHPAHPLAGQSVIGPADLKTERVLLSKTECSYRMMFQQLLADAKVSPQGIMEVNCTNTIKRLVAAGFGITILPKISVNQEIDNGELVALSWKDDDLEIDMLMIWYKNKWISPVMKAFMEITTNVFEGSVTM